MSVAQVRPTFSLNTEMPADQVMRCIQRSIAESPNEFQGQFTSYHAMISIEPARRRFWSPWLHLEVRDGDDGREVFGRFSPHPSIWTGFMFSWLAIAVLVFFAAMFGISQQMAGEAAWAWYMIPVLLVIAALLWVGSQAGQRLSHDEMIQIRSKIEQCVRGHG